jgi:hypothetical protein
MSDSSIMVHKRKGGSKVKQPSPVILQRAAKALLFKCKIPRGSSTYLKLKRHHSILKKLAGMKGSQKRKQAFVKRHRKQIGGVLPFLPLILKLVGALAPAVVSSVMR